MHAAQVALSPRWSAPLLELADARALNDGAQNTQRAELTVEDEC